MLVLGIESSCDESALALVAFQESASAPVAGCWAPCRTQPRVVREVISSQIALHALYGGVVPELASREHLKNFPLLFESLWSNLQGDGPPRSLDEVTHLAVTTGPGLKGCLLIGVGIARGIAMSRGLPLLPVNHIEGHILAAFLEDPTLEFPFLALVVSGGHTELVLASAVGEYRILSRTIDDAAGEAFDKSAHLLGLSYPGGPELSALAAGGDPLERAKYARELPKVMRDSTAFSFSGLKTAISLMVKRAAMPLAERPTLKASLAAAIQDAIVEALVHKVRWAVGETGIRRLVVTGGVAANQQLRKVLAAECSNIRILFPRADRCSDNAAMIALVGGLRALMGDRGTYAPKVLGRWPVETLRGAAS